MLSSDLRYQRLLSPCLRNPFRPSLKEKTGTAHKLMCNTRLFLRSLRPVIYYFLFLFLLFSANPPVPREATASPSISRMLVGSPVLAVLLVLVLPEEVVVLLPVPEVVMLFLDAAGVAVGVVVGVGVGVVPSAFTRASIALFREAAALSTLVWSFLASSALFAFFSATCRTFQLSAV